MSGAQPYLASAAYLDSQPVAETRALITELCRHFYTRMGGSITVKVHDETVRKAQQLIIMSPSGVQKERMEAEDMYVLAPDGSYLFIPSPKPWPHKPPKCSDCAPLFLKAYDMRNAGAVMEWNRMINPSAKEFRITHMEMIKGIQGHGDLTNALTEAIEAYPKVTAVLVRNHRIYIWGDSWISAKTQRCILLDIDGTTTPISFVSDTLFPCARENVGRHLLATYHSDETRKDIDLLRSQIKDDLAQGVAGSIPVPSSDSGEEEVIAALVANVEAMINAGHIWRTGFEKRELEGVVYEDTSKFSTLLIDIRSWRVYIYSSGSRMAQWLLFGNTAYRDLRKYISGYFDTNVRAAGSNSASEILFPYQISGFKPLIRVSLEAIISGRRNHGFETVRTFLDTSKLP
uniref:Class II aldolase/adducin N-terminal domain-containing protein n=1 Tax=Kalanchoe fedtschenkoi TaxID=63787 RepID=A0A7N0SWI2_KALFE